MKEIEFDIDEGILLELDAEELDENIYLKENDTELCKLVLTNKHIYILYKKKISFFKSEEVIEKKMISDIKKINEVPMVDFVSNSEIYIVRIQFINEVCNFQVNKSKNGKIVAFDLFNQITVLLTGEESPLKETLFPPKKSINLFNKDNNELSFADAAQKFGTAFGIAFRKTVDVSKQVSNRVKDKLEEQKTDTNKTEGEENQFKQMECQSNDKKDEKSFVNKYEDLLNESKKQNNATVQGEEFAKTGYKCHCCGALIIKDSVCPVCGSFIVD